MHPNAYSLVSVCTRPEKGKVDVTFANTSKKVTKSYSFFPSLYLPHTSTTLFEELVSQTNEKIQLVHHPDTIQVIAPNWIELKKIALRIHSQTNYFPLLIEPERQFLLTQNWRYFQTFDEKLNPTKEAFAETKIEGLIENLHVTLNGLANHNPGIEKQWRQRVALSHELFLPYHDVPLNTSQQLETWMNNHFFSRQTPLPIQKGNPISMENWTFEKREKTKKRVQETPLTQTKNCSCCIPQTILEKHIHPGSVVTITPTMDGIYLPTQNEKRSRTYHENNPNQENRIERAREFGLPNLPIGPLHRNKKIELPLEEALQAQKQKIVTISYETSQLTWNCHHTENETQKLFTALEKREHEHAQIHAMLVQPYLNRYQLAYTIHAQHQAPIRLHETAQKQVSIWKEELPNQLLAGTTAWRNTSFTTLLAG